MSNQYLGEIRIFSFGFAPKGWAQCNGQTMSIQQNTALFSLLGTFYGGDGVRTFQLPNLQGRVPLHWGQLAGGSAYTIGEVGGSPAITLTNNQTGHTHVPSAATAGTTNSPTGAYPAGSGTLVDFASTSDGSTMASTMLSSVGGSQPHSNLQPSLVLNICIALTGIFPSRN
jgi:microcystin-dependent protein